MTVQGDETGAGQGKSLALTFLHGRFLRRTAMACDSRRKVSTPQRKIASISEAIFVAIPAAGAIARRRVKG